MAANQASPVPPPSAAPPAPAPRIVEVRLALSKSAAQSLAELRVRRLLEIELEESAVLAPGVGGPLGDHVAYIWVDQPSAAQVVLEVRVGDRPVAHRELNVHGLAGDVAGRLVAIAASEMVRTQMQPLRPPPKRPPPPRRPTAEEIELAARSQPALFFSAAAGAAVVPAEKAVLAGPSLAVGFRDFGASEALFARWLTGGGDAGAVRWLEVGLAADYRFWLNPSWRLALGGVAALSSVHFGDARVTEGVVGERDTWSARAGAAASLEARLGAPMWLALSLEPGAILRPVRYEAPTGAGALEGLWLGLNLSLQLERTQRPPIASSLDEVRGNR